MILDAVPVEHLVETFVNGNGWKLCVRFHKKRWMRQSWPHGMRDFEAYHFLIS